MRARARTHHRRALRRQHQTDAQTYAETLTETQIRRGQDAQSKHGTNERCLRIEKKLPTKLRPLQPPPSLSGPVKATRARDGTFPADISIGEGALSTTVAVWGRARRLRLCRSCLSRSLRNFGPIRALVGRTAPPCPALSVRYEHENFQERARNSQHVRFPALLASLGAAVSMRVEVSAMSEETRAGRRDPSPGGRRRRPWATMSIEKRDMHEPPDRLGDIAVGHHVDEGRNVPRCVGPLRSPSTHLDVFLTTGRAALTTTFHGSRQTRHVARLPFFLLYMCESIEWPMDPLREEHPHLTPAPDSYEPLEPRLLGLPRIAGQDAKYAEHGGAVDNSLLRTSAPAPPPPAKGPTQR